MPDVHLCDDVCIGTVLATRRLVYPAAVGGDIGCGVAALRFDVAADALGDARVAARVLHGLYARVPALRHPPARAPTLPAALAERPLSDPRLDRLRTREGRWELGTLGRGNHFLELQRDDQGALWLMLHSGSRALGQAIRDHHLGRAHPTSSGLLALDAETPAGAAYLADMNWALDWAAANRRALAEAAAAVVGDALGAAADWSTWVTCDHNHVRRERHDGEPWWIHRKGAIAAARGQPGLIPGSMGTPSFHTEGRGHAAALGSSSHGAGRALARGEARRAIATRDLLRQLEGVWFDRRRAAELRDEAPAAYKSIRAVMRAQRELTRTVRIVQPLLSYKG
jgi:tRNA-splicing ligase RtcB